MEYLILSLYEQDKEDKKCPFYQKWLVHHVIIKITNNSTQYITQLISIIFCFLSPHIQRTDYRTPLLLKIFS
ncbi:hypothetical protein FGO68_gene6659 [Halteria grandinella]|uniref:Uncharacterized protein n=1 Tax=Halteria grandinella TaxID=5974 RepID=A0A8J8T6G9_HALGN|nr:hypothetical protein FGO68_gene6659 [Halteria grandinella]